MTIFNQLGQQIKRHRKRFSVYGSRPIRPHFDRSWEFMEGGEPCYRFMLCLWFFKVEIYYRCFDLPELPPQTSEALICAAQLAELQMDGWLEDLKNAIAKSESVDWHSLHEAAEALAESPDSQECLKHLSSKLERFYRYKCSQCYGEGERRYAAGYYAGKFCDFHWREAGYTNKDMLLIEGNDDY